LRKAGRATASDEMVRESAEILADTLKSNLRRSKAGQAVRKAEDAGNVLQGLDVTSVSTASRGREV